MLGDKIQDIPDSIHEPCVRSIFLQLIQDLSGLR